MLIRSVTRMAKTSNLTVAQLNLIKKFSTLTVDTQWVQLGANATQGDVLLTLAEQMDHSETEVQRNYRERYQEKLRKKAKEEGFHSVDELISQKLAKKNEKPPQEPKNNNNPKQEKPKRKDVLPSYAQKLNDIVNMNLLQNESAEKISTIWNSFHSSKDCLSASIPSDTYMQLHARGKEFPMVYHDSSSLFFHYPETMVMSYSSFNSPGIRFISLL